MNKPFKTVGLIARRGNRDIVESVLALEQFLHARNVAIVFEKATATLLPNARIESRSAKRWAASAIC